MARAANSSDTMVQVGYIMDNTAVGTGSETIYHMRLVRVPPFFYPEPLLVVHWQRRTKEGGCVVTSSCLCHCQSSFLTCFHVIIKLSHKTKKAGFFGEKPLYVELLEFLQSLSQRSKTITSLTDSGSPFRATFQCTIIRRLHTSFSTGCLLVIFHFQDSKQHQDVAILLLSVPLWYIKRRRPWAPLWSVLCMVSVHAKKYLAPKVVRFGSPRPIFVIQGLLCRACLAL